MKTESFEQFSTWQGWTDRWFKTWATRIKGKCWLPSAMCLRMGAYNATVQVQIVSGPDVRTNYESLVVQFRRSKLATFEVHSESQRSSLNRFYIFDNIRPLILPFYAQLSRLGNLITDSPLKVEGVILFLWKSQMISNKCATICGGQGWAQSTFRRRNRYLVGS